MIFPIELNTKQELYDYLNNFDFDSLKDTKLSSVYFLVEFDDHILPIHFTIFDNVWFASPCCLCGYHMKDTELMELVKELYNEDSYEDAYIYEQTLHRNECHYEIHCPQCAPFLPDKIKIIDAFSDSKCLDWLLSQRSGEEVEE